MRSDLRCVPALITQEAIEIDDDEVAGEIDQLAERTGEKPEKVRKDLEREGLVGAVRSDLAHAGRRSPSSSNTRPWSTRAAIPSTSPTETAEASEDTTEVTSPEEPVS